MQKILFGGDNISKNIVLNTTDGTNKNISFTLKKDESDDLSLNIILNNKIESDENIYILKIGYYYTYHDCTYDNNGRPIKPIKKKKLPKYIELEATYFLKGQYMEIPIGFNWVDAYDCVRKRGICRGDCQDCMIYDQTFYDDYDGRAYVDEFDVISLNIRKKEKLIVY